jgi:hypothetical protein
MKVSDYLGFFLLGCWLILFNLQNILHKSLPLLTELLPVLAIVAGVLILLSKASLNKHLGVIFLAVWLILKGLWGHLPVPINGYIIILHLTGLLAGVLLLIRK